LDRDRAIIPSNHFRNAFGTIPSGKSLQLITYYAVQ
jgi:hypothetical protein